MIQIKNLSGIRRFKKALPQLVKALEAKEYSFQGSPTTFEFPMSLGELGAKVFRFGTIQQDPKTYLMPKGQFGFKVYGCSDPVDQGDGEKAIFVTFRFYLTAHPQLDIAEVVYIGSDTRGTWRGVNLLGVGFGSIELGSAARFCNAVSGAGKFVRKVVQIIG